MSTTEPWAVEMVRPGRLARYPVAMLIAIAVMTFVLVSVGVDVGLAVAADPQTSPLPVVLTGDPRSDGGGPGIVGSPLAILLGVVALGLLTAVITLVLARLTQRD